MMMTAQSDDIHNVIYQSTTHEEDSVIVLHIGTSSNSSSYENHHLQSESIHHTIQLVLDIVSVPQHGILRFQHDDQTNETSTIVIANHTTAPISLHSQNHRFPIAIGQTTVSVSYQLTDRTYFNTHSPTNNAAYGIINPIVPNTAVESFDFRIRAYYNYYYYYESYENTNSSISNRETNSSSSSNSNSTTNEPSNPTQQPPPQYKLISISPIVTQIIHVVHVNHPGTLIVPNPLQIAVSSSDIPWRPLKNIADVTTSQQMSKALLLSPIQYIDTYDYDMDYVRVDIWVEYESGGVLTLHDDGIHLANFCQNQIVLAFNTSNDDIVEHTNDTTSSSNQSWNCQGNGLQNHNMTFVAIPSDIEIILRYLQYEHIVIENEDIQNERNDPNIYIRIYDGIGGMCLNERTLHQLRRPTNPPTDSWDPITATIVPPIDHSTTTTLNITNIISSRREEQCYQTTAIIPIPTYRGMNHSIGISDPDVSWMLHPHDHFFDFLNIADVVFWGLVCLGIAGCTCIYRKLPHCAARGKAIDVEQNDDDAVNNTNHVVHPNFIPNWNDADDHFSISSGMADDRIEPPHPNRNDAWYRNAMAPPSDLFASTAFEAI